MVSPRVEGIGGVARHVSKLVFELKGRGFDVTVVSTENTFHIPIKGLYNPSFSLFSAAKEVLERLHGKFFDVAHGHNIPSWPAVKVAHATAKILTQHGVYSEQVRMLHGKLFGSIGKWVESRALKEVDALTCVSRSTCEYYRSMGIEAYYIPNAVDLDEMPKEELRLYDKQVVYVGRLSPEKGFDVLLEAANRIDEDIHLVIVGSGVRELEERALALAQRLSNFHFLGYKPREETLRIIKGSDLLILPSRIEGLPTVLLEAMAMKVPIIASRIPGVLDALDESCAVLIEPENPNKLAEAINTYVAAHPRTLVERAYERVVAEFNWGKVVQQYIELYERLLRG